MKKITLLVFVLGLSMTMAAQTVDFESDEIGSTGGTQPMWSGGTVDVVANPVIGTDNPSAQALHCNSTGYLPVWFDNVMLPAGAETMYTTISVQFLILGGTDTNYPTLDLFSSPDNGTAGDPQKFASITYDQGLWTDVVLNTWYTVTFSFANTLLTPIPAGNLIVKLAKSPCEYLMDNVILTSVSTGLNKVSTTNSISFSDNTIKISQLANQVDVFDLGGRLLVSKKNVTEVNVSNLNKGIYMVKVNVNGQTQVVKVVK